MVKIIKMKFPHYYPNLQNLYGFSLMEVLIALAILSIMSVNVTLSMLKALQTSRVQYLQLKQMEEDLSYSE